MKAGVTPQLSAKWWRDNRAKTLKSTGLAPALEKYERALGTFLQDTAKNAPYPTIEEAYKKTVALLDGDVTTAVKLGIKSCGILHKDTKDALTKYTTQVIPHALEQLKLRYKDAGKEYAVMVLNMDKGFKALASDMKSAMNIVTLCNDTLNGYVQKLTDYLDENVEMKPHDAEKLAMEASKYANEVRQTASKKVEGVLHDGMSLMDRYQDEMFLDDARLALKKHIEHTKDIGNQVDMMWKLSQKRMDQVGDLFKGVLRRTSGMEKVENQYFTSVDSQLLKVQSKCDELNELRSEVDGRDTKGLKQEVALAQIVTQETRIAKQMKKLDEQGLQEAQLNQAKSPLLLLKKSVLEEKAKKATEIYKFYQETVLKAAQGKDLALTISQMLDNLPETPEEVDIKAGRYQKRQKLIMHFRSDVLKANPIFTKGKEKAEERISYYDEHVFNRKK
ncbi:MAG: hypothetical protein JNM56_22055 [Planctomycetia bacterium]|nr:hypothetical protein [Planctomycetia bacterium]